MTCMACGQRAVAIVVRRGIEVAFCTIHIPAKMIAVAN